LKAKLAAQAKKDFEAKAAALKLAEEAKEARDAEIATAIIEVEDAQLEFDNANLENIRILALAGSTTDEKAAALLAKTTAETTKATKTLTKTTLETSTTTTEITQSVSTALTNYDDANTTFVTASNDEFEKEK